MFRYGNQSTDGFNSTKLLHLKSVVSTFFPMLIFLQKLMCRKYMSNQKIFLEIQFVFEKRKSSFQTCCHVNFIYENIYLKPTLGGLLSPGLKTLLPLVRRKKEKMFSLQCHVDFLLQTVCIIFLQTKTFFLFFRLLSKHRLSLTAGIVFL